MITGSREDHMAERSGKPTEIQASNKDYMLDDSLYGDDFGCEDSTDQFDKFNDNPKNWVINKPSTKEQIEQQIIEDNEKFNNSNDGWETKEKRVDDMIKEKIEKDKKDVREELKNDIPYFQEEFIPKAEDEGKIYLTNYELAMINLNAEKHRGFEKDKKLIDMKKQIINLQKAIIDAKKETLDRDEMIIEYHAINTSKEHENFKGESKEFLIGISNHHESLNGKKWGYNPESGEIIVNEDGK